MQCQQRLTSYWFLDHFDEGIQMTIGNPDVASDDVVDGGVVQEEYIVIDSQSPPCTSFGEDCVPCECVGHQTQNHKDFKYC